MICTMKTTLLLPKGFCRCRFALSTVFNGDRLKIFALENCLSPGLAKVTTNILLSLKISMIWVDHGQPMIQKRNSPLVYVFLYLCYQRKSELASWPEIDILHLNCVVQLCDTFSISHLNLVKEPLVLLRILLQIHRFFWHEVSWF